MQIGYSVAQMWTPSEPALRVGTVSRDRVMVEQTWRFALSSGRESPPPGQPAIAAAVGEGRSLDHDDVLESLPF